MIRKSYSVSRSSMHKNNNIVSKKIGLFTATNLWGTYFCGRIRFSHNNYASSWGSLRVRVMVSLVIRDIATNIFGSRSPLSCVSGGIFRHRNSRNRINRALRIFTVTSAKLLKQLNVMQEWRAYAARFRNISLPISRDTPAKHYVSSYATGQLTTC